MYLPLGVTTSLGLGRASRARCTRSHRGPEQASHAQCTRLLRKCRHGVIVLRFVGYGTKADRTMLGGARGAGRAGPGGVKWTCGCDEDVNVMRQM